MQLSTNIRRIGTIAALAGLPVTAALGAAGTANASMQAGLGGSAATAHTSAPPKAVQARPAVPKGASSLGAVAGSTAITGQLVLKPRDESGLKAFIANTSNKKSPSYRHYLSKGAFASAFGPSAATLNAAEAALKSGGLTVKNVAADHMFVTFSGTATKVEKTFGTGLAKYRLASGRIGTATTSSVKLPASLAPQVTGVLGLDSLVSENPMGIHRGSNAKTHIAATKAKFAAPTGSATSCADSTAAATDFGGLSDDQVAHAYGADGLYTNGDFGAGQNIAVFELEPFDPTDLATFDTCYFGATKAATMGANVTNTPVDGGQPAGAGSGESILDVEDVSAIAPDANVHVYTAPNSTFGAIDEYSQIINNDADQELTTSWGECEQTIQLGAPGQQQAENLLFMQAAAQGMSVFSAAGDEGSDDCNLFETDTPVSPILSVDDPSSQPYVVAAGGTTMDNATQPPDEHVWNDGAEWGAGGGGISESWTMPAWQLDATVPGINPSGTVGDAINVERNDLGDSTYAFCGSDTIGGSVIGEACRELPDVSANSDEFTGAITIYSASFGDNEADSWITIGGTSSAAPLWAGMLALVNASSTAPECTPGTGTGVGFVNPLLYAVASDPAHYAESFNDITAGNNDPYGASNEFPATAGYDMASGLGTPQLTGPNGSTGLAFNLCTLGADPTRPAISGLSPAIVDQGDPSAVTITGTNFGADSTVTVGSLIVPAAAISSVTPTAITFNPPPSTEFINAANDTSDGSGAYQVTVTSQGVTSTPSANSVLDYVNSVAGSTVPTVTSVSSYGGPRAGTNKVTINGSGFSGPIDVTFGGVDATATTVKNDNQIIATVPPFSDANTACDQSGALPGETAANDVCQTQVVVSNPNGSSATSTILPLFEGDFVLSPIAAIEVPNGQEAAPANTEYDYFPKPTITSVSTDAGDPGSLASEGGGTVVTIKGSGFNDAGLSEVLIGDPTDATSEDSDYTFISGTEIQIQAPEADPMDTVNIDGLELRIDGLGGNSDPSSVVYAGTPTVSDATATSGPSSGKHGAVDSGGVPVTITGSGLDSAELVSFVDTTPPQPGFPPFSVGTQYNGTLTGSTSLATTTVSQNPAQVDVEACSVTGCSTTSSADQFFLYPPGDPTASAAAPTSGPSGTPVTITGTNLGCASVVTFGGISAQDFSNAAAILDCGQTGEVDVIAPPLPAGTALPKTVAVTVSTVESDLTGATPVTTASFKYTAAKPAFVVKAKAPPAGTVGTAYSYTFSVSGTPSPTFAVTSGSLPTGLTLSKAGKLTGTPKAGGTFHFTVKLTNASGSASKSFSISVTGAPKFTKDSPASGKVGTSYKYTFVATGGPKPTFKVSSGKLPSGLKLSSGGVLSGKPTKAGTYHFKVTASNGHKPDAVTPNRTVTIKKK